MSEASGRDLPAAFQSACDRLLAEVRDACAPFASDWPLGVAAGVRAAHGFAAREPAAARLLFADVLLDPDHGLDCYDQLIASLAEMLREVADDGLAKSRITEEILIGGVVGVVRMQVSVGRTAELPAVAPEAIYFLLSPYLGAERAIEISELPPPAERP